VDTPNLPKPHELLPTRWSLLSRLKDWQDQQSWQEFYQRYWRLIFNAAVRSGLPHEDAQEVVQETIIAVAKGIGEFRTQPERGSFKGWLLQLTRWRIADQWRKRQRQAQHPPTASPASDRTATVERIPDNATERLEAEWDAQWEENLLLCARDRVKQRLKPEWMQMFDLLAIKHWPALRVARFLKVNLAQVYYAKHKVSSHLRREILRLRKEGR